MIFKKAFAILVFVLTVQIMAFSQTGSESEPVRYVGGVTIDPNVHEGRLRYAIGTESRQTLRVNRTHPELAEGSGWTYNHASNLCYWNGKFYQQYLSNPEDEHIAPGQTLITTSVDGRNWEKPQVVFPPYQAPEGVSIPEGYSGYMMHQRMGFYVAPNDRLLTLAFYGHAEDPFQEGGIGRVVREIYNDGSLGPIYFIRYSSHTSWNESNTSYPFYTRSDDKGFIDACNALLNDKLKTMQWWDEDRGLDGFYSIKEAGSAFSYYQRKDGKTVGLWKRSLCALSDDGVHFSKPVKSPTLIMAGGKMWGQATEDNRYAICYNPIEIDEYRYPLIVTSSDDGIMYDNMLLIQGEVPPRRFSGRWKDFGPCYVRGIVDGNGNPPGDDMWVTYSMNKEDMWVSRIPLPVKYAVEGNVDDNFNNLETGGAVTNWNIYAPKWSPVEVVEFPSATNKSMCLKDEDPYDYARAIRVFEETEKAEISVDVYAEKSDEGKLEIDVTDRYGNRAVRIRFDKDGQIKAVTGSEEVQLMEYKTGGWHNLKIEVNARLYGNYSLFINGEPVLKDAELAEAVLSVERISFRTGEYRDIPNRKTPNEVIEPPLPGADEKVPLTKFYIDDFKTR
ncbi:hypothetical protein OU798_22765 [Prolixibacteraceae bacterium Z1-6]|uniref:Six-hairpin glycosidase n=1 Tax=Draconibacterium aestuarii TaxID=2998507 RepID=A0A9X3F9P1_9BACT|nr:hypothetical protein [Prolixibacteraceae bacterium Z1-6]